MKTYQRQRLSVIGFYLSFVLFFGAILFLLPFFTGLCYRDSSPGLLARAFLLPALFSAVLSLVLRLGSKEHPLALKDAMAICTFSWLGLSALGAVPFVVMLKISYLDAYFETMSGFTTTGITVLTGLDHMPHAILFWRALTQWIGGLGILSMFLLMGIKGGAAANKLFMAEGHKIAGKQPSPALFRTALILWTLYIGFTVAATAVLMLLKLDFFDALTHAFTTLSTGGFSIYDQSIAHYRAAGVPHAHLIEAVIILFMLFGGINFFVHYRVWTGDIKAFWDNTEIRFYWGIVIGASLLIALSTVKTGTWIWPSGVALSMAVKSVLIHIKDILFQIVSVLTTTGYATRDINDPFFPVLAKQIFLVLMVIGGCAGSTGGGFKVIRVAILTRLIGNRFFRLNANRMVHAPLTLDKHKVESDELERIFAIFLMWLVLLLMGGGITAFFSDLNGWQSFSGMFSALGNIGPFYFSVGEMAALHPIIKVTYIFAMLAGRLEILPVLLLFSRRFYR